jgi:hypothetical protein
VTPSDDETELAQGLLQDGNKGQGISKSRGHFLSGPATKPKRYLSIRVREVNQNRTFVCGLRRRSRTPKVVLGLRRSVPGGAEPADQENSVGNFMLKMELFALQLLRSDGLAVDAEGKGGLTAN